MVAWGLPIGGQRRAAAWPLPERGHAKASGSLHPPPPLTRTHLRPGACSGQAAVELAEHDAAFGQVLQIVLRGPDSPGEDLVPVHLPRPAGAAAGQRKRSPSQQRKRSPPTRPATAPPSLHPRPFGPHLSRSNRSRSALSIPPAASPERGSYAAAAERFVSQGLRDGSPLRRCSPTLLPHRMAGWCGLSQRATDLNRGRRDCQWRAVWGMRTAWGGFAS
jgi:hypothetical protein